MACNQSDKACGGCPFSRQCKPGELGGSHISVYLGQIVGPFFLPCHAAANYQGNATPCTEDHMQCAGAAIFRSNIGVASAMPDPLLKLPAESDSNVFSTLEEFVRHHHPELPDQAVDELVSLAPTFMQIQMMNNMVEGRTQTAREAQANYSDGASG